MNYEELGNSILRLSKTIRFVEIYHNGSKFSYIRSNTKPLLEKDDTAKSIDEAIKRHRSRMLLADKLGFPKYTITEYEKIKRITIPFNKDGIILISIDHDMYHEILIKEILNTVPYIK